MTAVVSAKAAFVIRHEASASFVVTCPTCRYRFRGVASRIARATNVACMGCGSALTVSLGAPHDLGAGTLSDVATESEERDAALSAAGAMHRDVDGANARTLREMQERLDEGDWDGAIGVADEILRRDPRSADAHACRERATLAIEDTFRFLDASMDRMVVVIDARRADDSRSQFVLSLADGRTTLETILDLSGMPPAETLRLLRALLARGAIRLE